MMINYRNKELDYKRIALHLLFWINFLIWYSFINIVDRHSIALEYFKFNLIDYSYSLITLLISNYFIIYYLIPRFIIRKRKYITLFILSIMAILFADFSEILIRAYIYIPNYQPEYTERYYSYAFSLNYILINFFNKASIIIIFFFIKFFKDYVLVYFENQKLKQIKNEKEIVLLKKQLQPNLLFNTLKQIQLLNETNREEEAAESVELISDILRYSLYQDGKWINLNEELSVLWKYLKLHKINDPSFAIELLILDDFDSIKIQHLLLFNLVLKLISLTDKNCSRKELILTFNYRNDILILGISTTSCSILKKITYEEINALLDFYLEKNTYKIQPLTNNADVEFEISIFI